MNFDEALGQALASLENAQAGGPRHAIAPEIMAQKLRDAYELMNQKHEFRPGDLVTWKSGLKNGRYPESGQPAIVTRVYRDPILRRDMDSGSNHFNEPLDMVVMVDTGDELSEFHVDSRRFQPFTTPEEPETSKKPNGKASGWFRR